MVDTDVKTLMLQVDASIELLRKELDGGAGVMDRFSARAGTMADQVERAISTMGKNFPNLSQRAADAASQMEKAFNDSFGAIQRMADKAITMPAVNGGGLDDAARTRAAALEQIEVAAQRAAAGEGVMTAETRAYLQAAQAARIEAEAHARDLMREAGALERIEIELGKAGAAQQLMATRGAALHQQTGLQRAGMQQLAFQISDVSTQFSMGTPPMQIFAQQSSQVIQAVGMMTTESKGLLGILGNPWTQIVVAATVVLEPFIAKLFDSQDALTGIGDKAEQAMERVRRSLAQVSAITDAADEATRKKVEAMAEVARLNRQITQAQGQRDSFIEANGSEDAGGLNFNITRLMAQRDAAQEAIKQADNSLSALPVYKRAGDMQEEAKAHYARAAAVRHAKETIRAAGSVEETFRKQMELATEGLDEDAAAQYRYGAALHGGTALLHERITAIKKLEDIGAGKAKGYMRGVSDQTKDAMAEIRDDLTRRNAERNAPYMKQFTDPSPMEAYRQRLRASTSDMGRSLQQVKVEGLDALENGLVGIVSGTQSVADAFKSMANQVIADLARIAIEKLIVNTIGGGIFGFAEGGVVQKKATGGFISGPGTGTSDSIPAWLSNGEYVMKAAAVRRIGVNTLDAINNGMPRFASGGLVNPGVPRLRASSGAVGQDGSGVSMPITINAPGATAETVAAIRREIANAAPTIVQAAAALTNRQLNRRTI